MTFRKIDFSPLVPVVTQPDLFPDPWIEEAYAAALAQEVEGRLMWAGAFQDYAQSMEASMPGESWLWWARKTPIQTLYDVSCFRFSVDGHLMYRLRLQTQPELAFFVLLEPTHPDQPIALSQDQELETWCKRLTDCVSPNDTKTLCFGCESKGGPWGCWSMIVHADELRPRDARAPLRFHRLIELSGNAERYLQRDTIQSFAFRRLESTPRVVNNPSIFKTLEDEELVAVEHLAYLRELSGSGMPAHRGRSTQGEAEAEPGILDCDVYTEEFFSLPVGFFRVDIFSDVERAILMPLKGPSSNIWAHGFASIEHYLSDRNLEETNANLQTSTDQRCLED